MIEADANAICDVLDRECGAPEDEWRYAGSRGAFVRNMTSDRPTAEWRFCGALGFGGKFYPDAWGASGVVRCYPEDETPERVAMMGRANAALERLRKK